MASFSFWKVWSRMHEHTSVSLRNWLGAGVEIGLLVHQGILHRMCPEQEMMAVGAAKGPRGSWSGFTEEWEQCCYWYWPEGSQSPIDLIPMRSGGHNLWKLVRFS